MVGARRDALARRKKILTNKNQNPKKQNTETRFLGERELEDRRRIEKLPTFTRELEEALPADVTAGAPRLVVEPGAERKVLPPGPTVTPAGGGMAAGTTTTGGTTTTEETGGRRTIGEAIKETLGLGRASPTAGTTTTAGGRGGETMAVQAPGTKEGRADVVAAERAELSRAEA